MLEIYVVVRSQYSTVSFGSERLKIAELERRGEGRAKNLDRVLDYLVLKRIFAKALILQITGILK